MNFLTLILMAPSALASQTDLEAIYAEATELGVPLEPLRAKAAEGQAKGVPEARLVPVVDQLASDLARASTLLGAQAEGGERASVLSAAALALRAGASEAAVTQLGALESGVRARGLESLGDLLGQGFPETEVVRLIETAARGANPERSVNGVATAASLLVAAGVPPGQALEQASSGNGQGNGSHPLGNVPPQSRDDLPEPAQNSNGQGPK